MYRVLLVLCQVNKSKGLRAMEEKQKKRGQADAKGEEFARIRRTFAQRDAVKDAGAQATPLLSKDVLSKVSVPFAHQTRRVALVSPWSMWLCNAWCLLHVGTMHPRIMQLETDHGLGLLMVLLSEGLRNAIEKGAMLALVSLGLLVYASPDNEQVVALSQCVNVHMLLLQVFN